MYEHLLVLSLCVKSFFPPNGSEARGAFRRCCKLFTFETDKKRLCIIYN